MSFAIPSHQDLVQECESVARSINYKGAEWRLIARYLTAKRLMIAMEIPAAVGTERAESLKQRYNGLGDLLGLPEQYAHVAHQQSEG